MAFGVQKGTMKNWEKVDNFLQAAGRSVYKLDFVIREGDTAVPVEAYDLETGGIWDLIPGTIPLYPNILVPYKNGKLDQEFPYNFDHFMWQPRLKKVTPIIMRGAEKTSPVNLTDRGSMVWFITGTCQPKKKFQSVVQGKVKCPAEMYSVLATNRSYAVYKENIFDHEPQLSEFRALPNLDSQIKYQIEGYGKLMGIDPLPAIDFTDIASNYWGKANIPSRTIQINRMIYGQPAETIRETIIHELLHLQMPEQRHKSTYKMTLEDWLRKLPIL
jgi:hypothetical protein